jgi:hypothetical protein
MYRTTKRRMIQRVGVSAVLAIGVTSIGIGIAGASPHNSQATVLDHNKIAKSLQPQSTSTTGFDATNSLSAHDSSTTSAMISVEGSVVSISASAISVLASDGTSQIINVDSATTFTMDNVTATLADVIVGSSIEAYGVAGVAPGTIVATAVVIQKSDTQTTAPVVPTTLPVVPISQGDDQSDQNDGQGNQSSNHSDASTFAGLSAGSGASFSANSNLGGDSNHNGD